MVELNWHRNYMFIASSKHPVLAELRTLFHEGVTRSSKIIWSSVKTNWGTNNHERVRHYQWNSYPFKAVEIQAKRIILFSSFDPCLSHRGAHVKLQDEQTLLAPFYDHMAAAHGSHVSVTPVTSLDIPHKSQIGFQLIISQQLLSLWQGIFPNVTGKLVTINNIRILLGSKMQSKEKTDNALTYTVIHWKLMH